MKHIYAFEDIREYEKFQGIIQRFSKQLNDYQQLLEAEYALTDKPKGVSGLPQKRQPLFFRIFRFPHLRIRT